MNIFIVHNIRIEEQFEEQFVYDKNQNKKICQRFSLIEEILRQSFCK